MDKQVIITLLCLLIVVTLTVNVKKQHGGTVQNIDVTATPASGETKTFTMDPPPWGNRYVRKAEILIPEGPLRIIFALQEPEGYIGLYSVNERLVYKADDPNNFAYALMGPPGKYVLRRTIDPFTATYTEYNLKISSGVESTETQVKNASELKQKQRRDPIDTLAYIFMVPDELSNPEFTEHINDVLKRFPNFFSQYLVLLAVVRLIRKARGLIDSQTTIQLPSNVNLPPNFRFPPLSFLRLSPAYFNRRAYFELPNVPIPPPVRPELLLPVGPPTGQVPQMPIEVRLRAFCASLGPPTGQGPQMPIESRLRALCSSL